MRKASALSACLIGASLLLSGCAFDAAQQNSRPIVFLRQADQAVKARDAPQAIADLNGAENAWIGGNTPFTSPFFTFDPEPLRYIARARQAVEMQNWSDAEYYVRTALDSPTMQTPGSF